MEIELLGQKAKVKAYLPYKEKVECAKELVSRAAVFDESGVAYWGHLKDAVYCLFFLKAYTNMDMSAYESEEGLMRLMDEDTTIGSENAKLQSFMWGAHEDWKEVCKLAETMFANAAKVHEKQCSLEMKIKESFAFLLDGKDLTETLAQAKDVNEQMIDHLGEIAQAKNIIGKSTIPINLRQYAKKKQ